MPESLPLEIKDLSFQYQRRTQPAINRLNFSVHQGELLLIAGSSGCGKTTLMRCINGLIPHTYQGIMKGDISLFGKTIKGMELADISQIVGTLLQDPERQILGSYVLNEVAFGLESLGLPRNEIITRVEKALDRLNILHLKDRETFGTSGGEKQKIALAGVLAMEPRILLLDEPLASLDPASSKEALQAFRQLANEGISVLIVEHRVEDVLSIHPDKVIYMDEGKVTYQGDVNGMMEVVDYHRIKLPAPYVYQRALSDPAPKFIPQKRSSDKKETLVKYDNVFYQYHEDSPFVLKGINLEIKQGDVIAILGHNGSGKTTLVKHALGLLKPTRGNVFIDGKNSRDITVAQAARMVGYVFQSPSQMLFAPTVQAELAFGPKNLGFPAEVISKNVKWSVKTVNMESELEMPPLALSFGQQKRISIAAILAMRSRILMMDEPTAGQDYWNYQAFMDAILQMPGFDSIIFITHDLDLALIYANRILLVYNGEIIADGVPEEVLKNQKQLISCRVLPTSLLQLNLDMFQKTGKFYRAETLAHLQSFNK